MGSSEEVVREGAGIVAEISRGRSEDELPGRKFVMLVPLAWRTASSDEHLRYPSSILLRSGIDGEGKSGPPKLSDVLQKIAYLPDSENCFTIEDSRASAAFIYAYPSPPFSSASSSAAIARPSIISS